MTKRQKQTKFAIMLGALLVRAFQLKTPVFINQLYRTQEEQIRLVKSGKSKTLKSDHLDGLAVDLIFLEDVEDDGVVNFKPQRYEDLGLFWESIGGEWGGRYGDNPKTPEVDGWDSCHFGFKEK